MTTWLPITVVAGVHLTLRSIWFVSAIWRERVHATANREQIEAAAANGALVYECRDGSGLLIVPASAVRAGAQEDETACRELRKASAS